MLIVATTKLLLPRLSRFSKLFSIFCSSTTTRFFVVAVECENGLKKQIDRKESVEVKDVCVRCCLVILSFFVL